MSFFKKILPLIIVTIRVPNSLDLDQARHFAGPDLGPNCKHFQQKTNAVTRGGIKFNSFLASGDFCCLLITFANSLDPNQD